MNRQQRYAYVLDYFRREMGTVDTELHFASTFQLLVAVVLSAQCTDKRVNMISEPLFRRFPDAQAMASASETEILEYVKSVSYPNAKAHHLYLMAQMLVEKFGGEVPSAFDDLLLLPGVGRKTANVVQAVAFGKATMAVDTHVYRVSHRLGLVPRTADTPLKVERVLMANIPETDVPKAHHWLLLHGRYVCTSRAPHCSRCGLADVCPKQMDGSKL